MSYVVLADVEDTFPPSQPVVRVGVLGDTVYLTLCKHEETANTMTLTDVVSTVVVSRQALFHAILTLEAVNQAEENR